MGQIIISTFAAMCVLTALIGLATGEMKIAGVAVAAWLGDAIIARVIGIMDDVPAWKFILAPFILIAILIFVLLGITALRGAGNSNLFPIPHLYNGMSESDIEFYQARGMLNDALIIETAARLNQQDTGRELGPIVPVYYEPHAPYEVWVHAAWIADYHPEAILNPWDIEATDAERQGGG